MSCYSKLTLIHILPFVGVSPYACNVPNVVFLEAAHPVEGEKDTFRVFFGAADATIGSATVKVTVSK